MCVEDGRDEETRRLVDDYGFLGKAADSQEQKVVVVVVAVLPGKLHALP